MIQLIKYILICFIFGIQSSSAQIIVTDSTSTYVKERIKIYKKTFPNLYQNSKLDSIGKIINEELNSLQSCLSVLIISAEKNDLITLDSASKEIIFKRLEEIAASFFYLGTPIILVGNGEGSWDYSQTLNSGKNPCGIFYLSQGDQCVITEDEFTARQRINKKTKELIKQDSTICKKCRKFKIKTFD